MNSAPYSKGKCPVTIVTYDTSNQINSRIDHPMVVYWRRDLGYYVFWLGLRAEVTLHHNHFTLELRAFRPRKELEVQDV